MTFVPRGLSDWLMHSAQAEQRRFGSAIYMPLTDGAIYHVVMTQSGLNAEAVNPIARDAVARRHSPGKPKIPENPGKLGGRIVPPRILLIFPCQNDRIEFGE